jgi:ABC-type Fe3+-hydroxamate transport system substrate-binding protein
MRIRQLVFVFIAAATSDVCAQDTKGVVTLPGVHASATPGCVEHADGNAPDSTAGAVATLSYGCLNHLVANDVTPVPMPDADTTKRPSNTLGLYNANSLSHRMGQNLGVSVQPYRPRVTYPTPLATKP